MLSAHVKRQYVACARVRQWHQAKWRTAEGGEEGGAEAEDDEPNVLVGVVASDVSDRHDGELSRQSAESLPSRALEDRAANALSPLHLRRASDP